MKLAATVDYTRMTMMKDVILNVAGRYSDLEEGSAPENVRALQALTCLVEEAALTLHTLVVLDSDLPVLNISSELHKKTSSQTKSFSVVGCLVCLFHTALLSHEME